MNDKKTKPTAREYSAEKACGYHRELLPHILRALEGLPPGARILDLGCGNGIIAGELIDRGFHLTGIDISESGIEICKKKYPGAAFHVLSVTDENIRAVTGDGFDAIVSSEVIEHIYSPALFLRQCKVLLKPAGILVLTTPYHGYLKNLLLALSGQLTSHFQANHEGGHIKFWSRPVLEKTLRANGFRPVHFSGSGRIPGLWKSMIIKAINT